MISIEGGIANYGYAAFYGSLTETGKISFGEIGQNAQKMSRFVKMPKNKKV